MNIINRIKNYFNSPFSCKEEEIAFANFLVTKVQNALRDDTGKFVLPNEIKDKL